MKVVLISAAFCLFLIVFAITAGWQVSLGLLAVIGAYALFVRLRRSKGGLRRRYLDDWPFEPGEAVLWRDDRADCLVVSAISRARNTGVSAETPAAVSSGMTTTRASSGFTGSAVSP